jgi:F-type H+-transporting ATPase subunit epsilon
MAERAFQLEVVTPDRVVLSEDATLLVAPGVEGYLGVMAHHAPLVTELAVGELRYTGADGRRKRLAVSGGFMQVADNHVTVLADTAERVEEIDADRARAALDQALQELQELAGRYADARASEARAALERARNRLKLASGEEPGPR